MRTKQPRPASSKTDQVARRKGAEQREAAEKGKTLSFYIKEVAAKALGSGKKSRHFAK
jgi:hypothetical protein